MKAKTKPEEIKEEGLRQNFTIYDIQNESTYLMIAQYLKEVGFRFRRLNNTFIRDIPKEEYPIKLDFHFDEPWVTYYADDETILDLGQKHYSAKKFIKTYLRDTKRLRVGDFILVRNDVHDTWQEAYFVGKCNDYIYATQNRCIADTVRCTEFVVKAWKMFKLK